ncbi:MAG: hypothetical protein V1924_00415, partial [Candidatus Bathyarchaeota archaeon]
MKKTGGYFLALLRMGLISLTTVSASPGFELEVVMVGAEGCLFDDGRGSFSAASTRNMFLG